MSISVSATELSSYAGRYPCLRCAWVRMHVKDLPYQSLPAIFSSIDSYTKKVVASHFQQNGNLPNWLRELGKIEDFINPPGWRKFFRQDPSTEVTVRGEADAIFQLEGGSFLILDYKTSKYNPKRIRTMQVYEIQLNAYAWIAEGMGYSPVNKLYLAFMEPKSDGNYASSPDSVNSNGFSLGFKARLVPVRRRPESLIPPILEKVLEVADMEKPPQRTKCRDCDNLDSIVVKIARGEAIGF